MVLTQTHIIVVTPTKPRQRHVTHRHTHIHSTLYSRYKPCIHQVRWEEVTRGCDKFTWCHLIYYTLYKKKKLLMKQAIHCVLKSSLLLIKFSSGERLLHFFQGVARPLLVFEVDTVIRQLEVLAPSGKKKKISWDRSRGYDLFHERSFFFLSDPCFICDCKRN